MLTILGVVGSSMTLHDRIGMLAHTTMPCMAKVMHSTIVRIGTVTQYVIQRSAIGKVRLMLLPGRHQIKGRRLSVWLNCLMTQVVAICH